MQHNAKYTSLTSRKRIVDAETDMLFNPSYIAIFSKKWNIRSFA